MKLSILFGACALAVARPSTAAGQHPIEAGIARDAGSGAPIECLHVSVLDSARNTIAHAVTDSAGQFEIEVPGPASYRVQFEVWGWAPLVGPVDTLADGDFRQRVYPVAVRERLQLDTTMGLDSTSGLPEEQRRQLAKRRSLLALVAAERASGWQNPKMNGADIGLIYPPRRYWARDTGSVLASFIVDSAGRMRANSWRTISATHSDFASAVKNAMPNSRWTPARLWDRPVCTVVQSLTTFDFDGRVARVIFE